MDTLNFILKKYNVTYQPIVPLMCTRWGSLGKLFRQLGFKLGVEVGVERGRFSKHLCLSIPNLKLYCVDAWQVYEDYRVHVNQERLDNFFLETKERLKPFNAHLIRDWSMSAVRRFADNSLDFVFIDAAHDYKHVKEDIWEWHKKVRPGGIVSGHDYFDGVYGDAGMPKTVYGVKTAVNEWVAREKLQPLFIMNKKINADTTQFDSWFYVKI